MQHTFDPGTKAEETQEQAAEATETQATEEKTNEGQGALVD